MNTTVYLIRHSVRMNRSEIETYKTIQPQYLRDEKIILSTEGEKRAKILANQEELNNIDIIYVSNFVRTLQTAKYMMEKEGLKANIDERLNERLVGKSNDDIYPDWFTRQYTDENYSTIGGESQKQVRERMYECVEEIVKANSGKRIAIFSHGYAITFLLLKWCKLDYIDEAKNMKITYNDQIIINKKVNSPDVFKIEFDSEDMKINSIKNIEFDELTYKDFKD